jgi:phosphoribosylformylglycinamidine synthase I
MATLKVIVLRAAGINCDQETLHAFQSVGAQAQTVHINRLIDKPEMLDDYQILVLPGGFSYGDDIAAGKILAGQLLHHLQEAITKFVDSDKLVLGICNGFQILVKAGLLPGKLDDQTTTQNTTIAYNDSGKFEDRWVHLEPGSENCVFITPGQRLYLPIAHGEGKVCFANEGLHQKIIGNKQIAFRYVDQNGNFGSYPINPNGSNDHIAGLCDSTGRILGLMPHPERNIHKTHHPRWTRETIEHPDGRTIFQNAINYFS